MSAGSRLRNFATVLPLGVLVVLVVLDNELERVPYLYTESSLWMRVVILFPLYLAIFLALPWKSEGAVLFAQQDAALLVRLGALVLGAAGMAWLSISIAVWLATVSEGLTSEERYRIKKISCLRDLCQVQMQSLRSAEVVRLPLPRTQVTTGPIEVGYLVTAEEKDTFFGTLVRRIERAPGTDATGDELTR
jgi:hypothetical protein